MSCGNACQKLWCSKKKQSVLRWDNTGHEKYQFNDDSKCCHQGKFSYAIIERDKIFASHIAKCIAQQRIPFNTQNTWIENLLTGPQLYQKSFEILNGIFLFLKLKFISKFQVSRTGKASVTFFDATLKKEF